MYFTLAEIIRTLTKVNKIRRNNAAYFSHHRAAAQSSRSQHSWVELHCVSIHNRKGDGHCKLAHHLQSYSYVDQL